uniref:Uncharacterized protein n=1 Tax=Octopus bimaculoides TaxID=37653 RepID=A0A0L8IHM7_OCTBM
MIEIIEIYLLLVNPIADDDCLRIHLYIKVAIFILLIISFQHFGVTVNFK